MKEKMTYGLYELPKEPNPHVGSKRLALNRGKTCWQCQIDSVPQKGSLFKQMGNKYICKDCMEERKLRDN
jgi:hypothetical protein